MRTLVLGAALVALGPIVAHAQAVPVGTPFVVNTHTTEAQIAAAADATAEAGFVIVWQSAEQDGDGYGVFGQRFDRTGGAVGTEFQVDTVTTADQFAPDVGADAAGNFIVVWTDDENDRDGDAGTILGRRYDGSGTPLSTPFQVNTTIFDSPFSPSVDAWDDGSFVVAWITPSPAGALFVVARRYDSGGAPAGGEILVSDPLETGVESPAVATDATGGFVVVWNSEISMTLQEVRARRFDGAGTPVGPAVTVSASTTATKMNAAVATERMGNSVVVWQQDASGTGHEIIARRLSSGGTPLGAPFMINTATEGNQELATVGMNAAGDFTVAWRGLRVLSTMPLVTSNPLVIRHFDKSGAPLSAEIDAVAEVSDSVLAGSSTGDFALVWDGDDGDVDGVLALRFDAPACSASPRGDCRETATQLLLLKDRENDARDQLGWKWSKGAATEKGDFGAPLSATEYGVCVYAGTAQALGVRATIPPGGTCGAAPCWSETADGFVYRDKTAAADGITKLLLAAGPDGKGKTLAKGRGAALVFAPALLPIADPATVRTQLVNSRGHCWEATVTTPIKNEPTAFKAK